MSQGYTLCLCGEKYSLQFTESLDIYFSRLGDPMKVFKIKQNDTAPALYANLLDENCVPVELTELNEIKFIMKESFFFKDSEEQIIIQNSDNISLDPSCPGKFQYNWSQEDTACSSDYLAEFQITLGGIKSLASETYSLSDGQTLEVKVNGGTTQIVTFLTAGFADISRATLQEVVDVINSGLTGAIARVTIDQMSILLQTSTTGLSGSIQVVGGTANDEFGFPLNLNVNRRISLPEKPLSVAIIADLDEN